eukprot:m.78370 g.78370  ORF g.78370 m.78370 type:complete len:101 (-) comp8159_c0_seq3:2576-2878(-)
MSSLLPALGFRHSAWDDAPDHSSLGFLPPASCTISSIAWRSCSPGPTISIREAKWALERPTSKSDIILDSIVIAIIAINTISANNACASRCSSRTAVSPN